MEKISVDPKISKVTALPKLLVVSSYRRACGIAQYVEFLEVPLRNQYDFNVEIAALPVDLLRSQSPYAKKAADVEFDSLINKVKSADIVNIQLEPGLLGFTPMNIWRRLKALLSASKKVIITYHTVPPLDAARFRLSKRGLINYLRDWRGNYVFDRLFSTIRNNPRKFHHIVQTAREARNFTLLGIDSNTITHQPLAFVSRGVRELMDHDEAKARMLSRFNLASCTLLGCFGFLSHYKGIEVAIRALADLPPDYHLLIVGGIHPEGIVKGQVEQPYITKLLNEIEEARIKDIRSNPVSSSSPTSDFAKKGEQTDIKKRIHFCGAPGNDEFNEFMLACDAVILPYAEVGQTSSGPAALALDMGRPLYCSHTKCFSELDRYEPGVLSFFEVGNHFELAEKLVLQEGNSARHADARTNYIQKFSVEHRAACYFSAAKELLGGV